MFTIPDQQLVPINTVEALAATVGTKQIAIRQDRILKILSYTAGAAGYVNATCQIIAGQQAGQTVALSLPIALATMESNMVLYYTFASDEQTGQRYHRADGSDWILMDTGWLSCFKGGSEYNSNSTASFRELAAGLVRF